MRGIHTLMLDKHDVLTKAVINAGTKLGLSQIQIGEVIGKDWKSTSHGIDADSKAGELALLLIRCYRSLYVLLGGKDEDMKHWMQRDNLHTQGVPAEQIKRVQGLTHVVGYLDAMRGKL